MKRKPRPRPANPAALPWRRARQMAQIAALLLFLWLLLATRGGEAPDVPPSLFFRFDPLALITATLAGRQWIAGLALALITLALTLLAGRVWCGWLCPLGTLLDLVRLSRRSRGVNAPGSLRWRRIKYLLLLVIVGAALAGSLSLMVFDPISLLTRGLTAFVLPGVNQGAVALERTLYDIPALENVLDSFETAIRTPLFPTNVWRWWNILPGLLLILIIGLNVVEDRFWCRYLCPLGGLLGLISRVALFRRVVGAEACRACVRCVRACPTGAIDPQQGFASDPAECVVCMDCLPECPMPQGQTFNRIWGLAPMQVYDPGRRRTLVALGTGLIAAAVYPLIPLNLRRSIRLIRPPGAQRNDQFLSACIRCAECLKVCPTSSLQPAIVEAGADGLWTPTLVPRLGYCDFACHACGQVCPTGAIPPLTLDEKRATKLGTAQVNQSRCLPWSQNTPCIVCEEMCPLAPKAIELDTIDSTDAAGQPMALQRPRVLAERCIGCGICEYKCPLEGEAAIQVSGV